MKNNKKKGFTLLELVITIAIISTLAVVAVPLTVNYITKGEISATEDEIRLASDSLQLVALDIKTNNLELSSANISQQFSKHMSDPQYIDSITVNYTKEGSNTRVVATIMGTKYYNNSGTKDNEKAVTVDMGTFSKEPIATMSVNGNQIYSKQ